MRILFSIWAWPSHLYAVVPVAAACQAAGHDVAVASQPALTDLIRRSGLRAVSVGRDLDAVPVLRDFVLPPDRPVSPPVSGPGRQPMTGPPRPPRVLNLFVDAAGLTAGDLLAFGREWRPDILVYDPTDFAGPIVAAALEIPSVRHLYGLDIMHQLRRFLPETLAPLCQRFGLSDVDLVDAAVVDPCPEELQLPVDYQAQRMRHTPYHGLGELSTHLDPPSRPRVCVTWGTTMARLGGGRLCLAGPVARALAGLDVEVLVAVTAAQRELLGDLPPAVRVVESQPLSALLPDCAALVHHGGAGSMLAGLRCGLPQLVVPQLPDHALHARQLVASGAGLALNREQATTEGLREGVADLLDQPGHRKAAGELAEQMRSASPPHEIVAHLESLRA